MEIFLLIIGIILIVSAFRDTYRDLFTAVREDVPSFVVVAAAILAVGLIGYIPTLKPVSRGLLALIVIVLVLNNYKKIISGLNDAWQNPVTSAPADKGATVSSSSNSSSGMGDFSSMLNSSGGITSGLGNGGSANTLSSMGSSSDMSLMSGAMQ